MDVDLVFYTNTTHSWGIHGNGMNTMQTNEEEQAKTATRVVRKRTILTPTFSLLATVSAIYSARSKKNTRTMTIC
jgi:hypothetical protein